LFHWGSPWGSTNCRSSSCRLFRLIQWQHWADEPDTSRANPRFHNRHIYLSLLVEQFILCSYAHSVHTKEENVSLRCGLPAQNHGIEMGNAWRTQVAWKVWKRPQAADTEESYTVTGKTIRGCIQKFPDWVDNEINNNKHSLRSNTKGYGGTTH
jgi:hypothetical protein